LYRACIGAWRNGFGPSSQKEAKKYSDIKKRSSALALLLFFIEIVFVYLPGLARIGRNCCYFIF
jgi:hypothetical protein